MKECGAKLNNRSPICELSGVLKNMRGSEVPEHKRAVQEEASKVPR